MDVIIYDNKKSSCNPLCDNDTTFSVGWFEAIKKFEGKNLMKTLLFIKSR